MIMELVDYKLHVIHLYELNFYLTYIWLVNFIFYLKMLYVLILSSLPSL